MEEKMVDTAFKLALSILENIKKNPDIGTRSKLLLVMFFSHAYSPTRRFYLNKCRNHRDPIKYRKRSSLRLASTNECGSRLSELETVMPSIPLKYYLYYIFSTSTHCIGIFHAPILIIILNNCFGIDLHWNCYLLGRLCFHSSFAYYIPYFEFASTVLHSVWRYVNKYVERYYKLDCLVFLLADSASLKRQLEHDLGPDVDTSSETEFPIFSVKPPRNSYLMDILYMDIEWLDNSYRHLLRPNRSLKAREQLANILDWEFFAISVFCLTLLVSIEPVIFYTGFFDRGYIKSYPTCMPNLELLAREDRLPWWSVTLFPPNHRWLGGPADIMINLFTYLDGLLALVLPVTLAYLLTQDLMLYWQYIAKKLDQLRIRQIEEQCSDKICSSDNSRRPSQVMDPRELRAPLVARYTSSLTRKLEQFDLETHILQRQIIDFFTQLRAYDKFVSFLVTFLLIVWVIMFLGTSYFAIKAQNTAALVFIRAVQVYCYIALICAFYGLLKLRKFIQDTYPILSGIMARERVPRRKAIWSQVLELFTDKKNYGFTIMHSVPLTWLSFTNGIASSVSFLIVMETFRRYAK